MQEDFIILQDIPEENAPADKATSGNLPAEHDTTGKTSADNNPAGSTSAMNNKTGNASAEPEVTIGGRRAAKPAYQAVLDSRLYRTMQNITNLMDRYYLDGVAGLVPGGIGDIVSAVFAVVHVYFSAFRLRSIPLTLAILNNTLRDIFLGMLPFFVGDVIDFFHKANKRNMALIDGFLNDDEAIIHEVNRKATQSALVLIALVIGIILIIYALIWLTKTLGTALFS